jgi:predicted O-methyltransferase YrrM
MIEIPRSAADADKRAYRTYYETLLPLMRPGGLIAIDNVLWYGKVADPSVVDKATQALRDLNAFLMSDERIDFNIVPVGDGVAMCRVR